MECIGEDVDVSTGTFLRKPAGGWIHDYSEFQCGLSINYTVQVNCLELE